MGDSLARSVSTSWPAEACNAAEESVLDTNTRLLHLGELLALGLVRERIACQIESEVGSESLGTLCVGLGRLQQWREVAHLIAGKDQES